jgi:Domain of unknown function (DUF5664)
MKKFDQNKLPYHLIPVDSLKEFVKVLAFGAAKYNERNWEQGCEWHRLYAAAQRHLNAWWAKENRDQESGLSHLAHALCCVIFLLTYELRKIGVDDRP